MDVGRGLILILRGDMRGEVEIAPTLEVPPDDFLSHTGVAHTLNPARLFPGDPLRSRTKLVIYNRDPILDFYVSPSLEQITAGQYWVVPALSERTIPCSGRHYWYGRTSAGASSAIDVHELGRHELDVDPTGQAG